MNIIRFCLVILLAVLVVACAQPKALQQSSLTLAEAHPSQKIAIDRSPAKLELQLTPHAQSSLTVALGGKEPTPYMRLIFSDKDCATGYRVAIEYWVSEKEVRYQQFPDEYQWNNPKKLTLTWDESGRFSIFDGAVELVGNIHKLPSQLGFSRHRGSVTVDQLIYLPKGEA